MVSAYLDRPIRTLEQALEDRARVWEGAVELERADPAAAAVDRYDPIGVLVRLLANDHGPAADDPAPPGGRRAA
jgi:hypothetical protein